MSTEAEQDVKLRAIIEQSLHHLPLCLNSQAAVLVASDMLRTFKRNGVIFEFGPVPETPTRRHLDTKPEGFHHG